MPKLENNKITFPGMVKIKLTKIKERFDAEVPNNIPINDYRIGYIREGLYIPQIGMSYGIENVCEINGEEVNPLFHYFITSEVIEIIDSHTFKTRNSIYQIEYLGEE